MKKLKNEEDIWEFTPLPSDIDEALHYATISFISESKFIGEPIFELKRDLLFDLQAKAANHVNRLGNYQLEE